MAARPRTVLRALGLVMTTALVAASFTLVAGTSAVADPGGPRVSRDAHRLHYSDSSLAGRTTARLSGTLQVVHPESGATLYGVRTSSGHTVRVLLPGVDDVSSGDRFSGEVVATSTSARRVASATVTRVSASEVTTRRLFMAVVTNFPGTAATSASVLTTAQNVAAYWQGQSTGHITSFTAYPTVKRFATTHPEMPNCGLNNNDFFVLTDEARALFGSLIGPDDTIVVVVPETCRGDSGSIGLGGGNAQLSANYDLEATMAHEEGHVLDLLHANIGHCDVTCLFMEYGDYSSVMGPSLGTGVNTRTPLNAVFRDWLGWTSPGEQQTLALPDGQSTATRRVTLAPRSTTSGLRSVQVPDPDSDGSYFVEYRTPTGRDVNSVLQHPEYAGGTFEPGGVSVLYETQTGTRSTRSASYMELTGTGEAFRQPGETYTSFDGRLRVDVVSADDSGATVDVTVQSTQPGFAVAPMPSLGQAHPLQEVDPGVDPADLTPVADAVDYQWSLDGQPVKDGFGWGPSYLPQPADVGKQLTVTVTARKAGYRVARRTSAPVEIAWMTPQTPVVTGTPEVGNVLHVSTGDWGTGVDFTYRWLVGTTVVGQPDDDFLVLTSAMAGKQVQVEVTGSIDGVTETRSSAVTAPVVLGWAPKVPTYPTPRVGKLLTVTTGDWGSGVTFTYRWYLGTTAITNATKPTYTPTASQLGKYLSVKVTGSKAGHTTTSKLSAKAVIARGVLATVVPTITGTPKVGQILTAHHGTWTTGTTFKYRWLSNGVAITNATASTYKLPSTKVGKNIKVRVTGSKPGYTTVALVSAAVGPVVR